MLSLLWAVFLILVVLWVVGFAVNWGSFMWLLLVAAVIVLASNLMIGSRRGRWY